MNTAIDTKVSLITHLYYLEIITYPNSIPYYCQYKTRIKTQYIYQFVRMESSQSEQIDNEDQFPSQEDNQEESSENQEDQEENEEKEKQNSAQKNGKPNKSKSNAGRPKKKENQTPIKLKSYFSNNTAAMILSNSNYIHVASQLLQELYSTKKMQGTTTFCFYEGFFDDGNYKKLPYEPQEFKTLEGGEDIQRLIQSLMVTMPKFVFDEFLELILLIMRGVSDEKSNDEIEGQIQSEIKKYPYLTFKKEEALKRIGYCLPDKSVEKLDEKISAWLGLLVSLVRHEINAKDDQITFDKEYNKSQNIKTTIPWVKKRIDFESIAKRKKTKVVDKPSEDNQEEDDEKDSEDQRKKDKETSKSKKQPKASKKKA